MNHLHLKSFFFIYAHLFYILFPIHKFLFFSSTFFFYFNFFFPLKSIFLLSLFFFIHTLFFIESFDFLFSNCGLVL